MRYNPAAVIPNVGAMMSTAAAPGDGLGPELITNGGFDADTDWTLRGDAAISGGVLSWGNLTVGDVAQQTLAAGEQPAGTYRVSWTQTGAASEVSLQDIGVAQVGPGAKSQDVVMGAFFNVSVRVAENGAGTIDNLSIRLIPAEETDELNSDQFMDSATGWSTIGGSMWDFGAVPGAARSNGSGNTLVRDAADTLTAGTYNYRVVVSGNGDGGIIRIHIGGAAYATSPTIDGNGTYEGSIIVPSVTTNNIGLRDMDGVLFNIEEFSLTLA